MISHENTYWIIRREKITNDSEILRTELFCNESTIVSLLKILYRIYTL